MPAILRQRQRFVVSELVEGMGQVNEPHAVVGEGKAFADVVALNILGPSRRSQDVSYHRNSRQEDGWRVVEIVPTTDSGKAAADVDFDFRGRHVPTC